MGEFEWLQILANLEKGQSLKDAVADANATAKQIWHQYDYDTGTMKQVPAQAWQVIGNGRDGGAGIHF